MVALIHNGQVRSDYWVGSYSAHKIRHLALCYNRPLSFTDVECSGLLQPIDDHVWQTGDYFVDSAQSLPDPTFRRRGPAFECTGHSSIFEFFLPLMTILGEIVDLTHARNHPRFGAKTDWDDYGMEISQRLDAYGRSLQEMQQRTALENNNIANETTSPGSSKSMGQEAMMHARIVVTYGTYLMHTLHVLLNGKWDPISLLDDNDLWISSQSFITATGHAVSAAEALNDILELDPDLSFMPFFFGIYLLQGSFLLLLIADKLQGEASANIVRACEVIVRAHEACIVTLNTEYQVRVTERMEPPGLFGCSFPTTGGVIMADSNDCREISVISCSRPCSRCVEEACKPLWSAAGRC